MGQVKKIGIQFKNIYNMEVDGCATMMGNKENVVSRDEGELWHRRLGHLHHGALKIMQQISTRIPMGTLGQLYQCKGCTMGKYVKSKFHEKENLCFGDPGESSHRRVCTILGCFNNKT
jgi:hypothetical protein